MMTISVIIPVYNAESYLGRCIDSVLAQTFQDFELILVEDGSPDNCSALCELYAKKDNRIRVIHQVNQGQAAARNNGVSVAQGEWISFVDADDLIHPQMLEILYKAVKESNVKMSSCQVYEGEMVPQGFFDIQTSSMTVVTINEEFLLKCYSDYFDRFTYWVVWNKLIHKSIVEQYPFTEGRVYEDNAIVFKWLYAARDIAICDNCMYFYFVNKHGTTKSGYSVKALDWLWALEEQINFYKQEGLYVMTKAVTTRYVYEYVSQYEKVLNLLKDFRLAKKMRRKLFVFCLKNKKIIGISRSQKADLASRLYPRIINLLYRIKKIVRG